MENHKTGEPDQTLVKLTEQEWAGFGVGDLAYIKQVMVNGQDAFGAFGADGTPLFAAATRELAEAALAQRDLEALSAH